MSLDELAEVGARVGSDVPFLVHEGAALVQGRGEDVTPVPLPKLDRILLLCPSIDVTNKTAVMFSHVSQAVYSRGTLTHKLAARVRSGGDCPPAFFFNAFGQLAEQVFPGWAAYRDGLAGLGATDITLTGAGPSMFAIPPSKELGTAWHLLLSRTRGWNAYLVEPYEPHRDGEG
jgi:4-diphosphocytidyl-2-C-methyl-D-erythritol kinase